jgi:hypothetical protein
MKNFYNQQVIGKVGFSQEKMDSTAPKAMDLTKKYE